MIGFVYKVIHKSNNTILPYIGSTIQTLSKRMVKHRAGFNHWKRGKEGKCMVYDYFEIHGLDNFIIIEIERYEVQDKQQLRAKEQEWIDKIKCCNKCNAYGSDILKKIKSDKKYKQTDKYKAASKRYAESDKRKEWLEKNKDHIREYHKEYEHIPARQEYMKSYRETYVETDEQKENRRRLKKEYKIQRIRCNYCNEDVIRDNISQHKKTQKHKLNDHGVSSENDSRIEELN